MKLDEVFEILLFLNIVLSLAGVVVNGVVYRTYRQRGRWIFLVLALNCLMFLGSYLQFALDPDPTTLQMRGGITLALASFIATPIVLAAGRGKCPPNCP